MITAPKKQQDLDLLDFGSIRISLMSPERIRELSYGEVKKTETLNYRTLKPERDGLFCEKIFGPVKDFECSCGKYKFAAHARHKDVTCDRCGVEVTESKVRRERIGHVVLDAPVAHLWYFGKSPSKIALVLDLPSTEVEEVIYGLSWIVVRTIEDIRQLLVASVDEVRSELLKTHVDATELDVAFREMLKEIDGNKVKMALPRKTILKAKYVYEVLKACGLGEIFQQTFRLPDEYYSKIKRTPDGILSEIIKKLIERVIDRHAGNLAEEKNWQTSKVQTNAEAILSLLKEEDLKAELNRIRERLLRISTEEHKNRIRKLFERYRHNIDTALEDAAELYSILSAVSSHAKGGTRTAIGAILEKKSPAEMNQDDLRKVSFTAVGEMLVEHQANLDPAAQAALDALFEKYGLDEISDPNRGKLIRRFRIIGNFLETGTKPEWMVMQILPVLPPDLRPLVPLEGGRFASSDLNELYRRIINRNNRLKKFRTLTSPSKNAPKLIILNEKRLLQEAVDALIENSTRKRPVMSAQKRPLKSLSDVLKGKQGRFRQNLLGKRIDYSGRSVIVVGPTLKLHQCGLPKEMALELFRPFVLNRLVKKHNIPLKTAKNYFKQSSPEIWDILEEVTRHHPVLLNRAPTLHRVSVQAFEPVLIEGKAIQVHPLVCAAYNADFDGDQMAVYVPLTIEAQLECRMIMMSSYNLFSPANGRPLVGPTQDMVMGIYYLTQEKKKERNEGRLFASIDEAICAHQHGLVSLNTRVQVNGVTKCTEQEKADENDPRPEYTTVGRILFLSAIDDGLIHSVEFKKKELLPTNRILIPNKALGKRDLIGIVEQIFQKKGLYYTVTLLDQLKQLGYHYATVSGLTISVDDMVVPRDKKTIIDRARKRVEAIEEQAKKGVITESERYNSIVDIWSETTESITQDMVKEMRKQEQEDANPTKPRFNSVHLMAFSGARGNMDQVRQLAAMRGLMSRPQKKIRGQMGEIIETPVISNFREGLSILEYYISTHGGRKGLADTALKTADAGYLTRRLVDVAHHVVVSEEDCGTIRGIKVSALKGVGDEVIESLAERIFGRVVLNDVVVDAVDKKTGEIHPHVIVRNGEMITREQAERIAEAGIESLRIRSVLTCESKTGICAKCYGIDLSRNALVRVGEAVGVVAAQSIGEPGTQLTLRTFHIGGAAARVLKQPRITVPFDGVVEQINCKVVRKKEGDKEIQVVITNNAVVRLVNEQTRQRQSWELPFGSRLHVANDAKVCKGDLIAEWDVYSIPVVAERSGRIRFQDMVEGKTLITERHKAAGGSIERRVIPFKGKFNPRLNIVNEKGKIISTYSLPVDAVVLVEDGEQIHGGDTIAKIPREEIRTKDVTGGLPRVEELFEARHPKNAAVISEIDGKVKIATVERNDKEGKVVSIDTVITIYNEKSGKEKTYTLPAGRHLLVYEDDRVESGEPLTDGVIDAHKYLEVRGPQHTQEFLLNEVQQVYRLQGVVVNDKHIEVIIKQMLSFVRIIDPGLPPKSRKDNRFYEFIYGEIVPRRLFEREVARIEEERSRLRKEKAGAEELGQIHPPKAEPVLLGISKVAGSAESFLSAASFQETSRVLTEAALEGRVDELTGLKENVIIGHLVPAGTGFYREETLKLRKEENVAEPVLKL